MALILPTNQAIAARPKCEEVIKKCDEALEAKNNALKISDLALTKCRDQTENLTQEVNTLREADTSIWRNPAFMFLLGALAGSTTYILIKK